jgi:hypothetical protein
MLAIRRGVDSPQMDERFFGTIEEARLYRGPEDVVRYA